MKHASAFAQNAPAIINTSQQYAMMHDAYSLVTYKAAESQAGNFNASGTIRSAVFTVGNHCPEAEENLIQGIKTDITSP